MGHPEDSADFRLLLVVLLLSVLCEFCTNVFGRADKGEASQSGAVCSERR